MKTCKKPRGKLLCETCGKRNRLREFSECETCLNEGASGEAKGNKRLFWVQLYDIIHMANLGKLPYLAIGKIQLDFLSWHEVFCAGQARRTADRSWGRFKADLKKYNLLHFVDDSKSTTESKPIVIDVGYVAFEIIKHIGPPHPLGEKGKHGGTSTRPEGTPAQAPGKQDL